MPSTFLKIENALKRANEFIDVGKRNSALETLCDAIRAKKHRSWQKVHEEIMFKYLELAVELRKSYVAKEGIFQYKLICQQTNIKSFEDVVRRYIDLAEEKAEWAKNRAASRTTDDVDDLDVVQTPEEILLSAVSSEDQQDRSERVKLIPWVRFLWEAYRQCLDILKNNVRTEALYHEIAHRAFQFCTKFNRKTEFRKLCDNLRTHMDYLKKTQMSAQQQPTHAQSHMVNLNNPESMAMHLETRLIQLESATQIELWQEAYRATDDIKRYGLLNLNKKPPKPQLMANYYQKLALVFWKADCHLFHAAALFRLFHLTRELKKTITQEEVQKMASKLVLATLTIPIPPNRPDIDKLVDTEENTVEIHQRNLASLLGLTTVLPTRSQLVKDLKRMGYLQHAYQPLQDLYKYLEVDFHPLTICERVQGVIQFIEDSLDMKHYIGALKNISILRLLKGVSQVYQTIEYNRLSELCPFADSNHLEALVVEAARRNDLQVRVDHRGGSLHFGTELCVSQAEEIIEGPHLQSMPSEQVRLQLVNTYSTLLRVRSMIEPDSIEQGRRGMRIALLRRYALRRTAEHEAVLARHSMIEDRKKQLEILGVRMEQEEKLRQEAKQRRLAEEENQRMQAEQENRERQQKDRETSEMKNLVAKQKIEATGIKEDIEQAKKEQKELIQKQRRLERRIDHLERAKRLQEIPLLEKEYAKRKELDRKIWEECEAQRIADIISERELAKQLSQRLHKLTADAETFATKVNQRHQVSFEMKLAAYNEKLAQEKILRLEARRLKRRDDRRIQWLTEKKKEEESKALKLAAENDDRRPRADFGSRPPERPITPECDSSPGWRSRAAPEPKPSLGLLDRVPRAELGLRAPPERQVLPECDTSSEWRSRAAPEPKPTLVLPDRVQRADFGSRGPPERPGFGSREPLERPGFGSREPLERPGFGSREPLERPGFGSREPLERPGFGSRGPLERPGFGSREPLERPGFGSREPLERPGFGSREPLERPGFGSREPLERPGFGSRGPSERPDFGIRGPPERSDFGARGPPERPGFGVRGQPERPVTPEADSSPGWRVRAAPEPKPTLARAPANPDADTNWRGEKVTEPRKIDDRWR